MFVITILYPTRGELRSYGFHGGWAAFYEVCSAIKEGYKVSVFNTETFERANW
jgi:hypothetical protein